MSGQIQIYTGNGKGKTTAAIGQAIRAAGAGLKVYIAQFIKGKPYAEIELIRERIPEIEIKQFGLRCFIVEQPTQEDIEAANNGLKEVERIILSGEFDMVVLDEITIALFYSLFKTDRVIKILQSRPTNCEIVITGRYAPDSLLEIADLVTEMKEIKHYYQIGINARKGIEY